MPRKPRKATPAPNKGRALPVRDPRTGRFTKAPVKPRTPVRTEKKAPRKAPQVVLMTPDKYRKAPRVLYKDASGRWAKKGAPGAVRVELASGAQVRARDPKTGRFAKVQSGARKVPTRRRGGKLEALVPQGQGAVAPLKRAPSLGYVYRDEMRTHDVKDLVTNTAQRGGRTYIRAGGRVFTVPKDRQGDLVLFLDSMASEFYRRARKAKAQSPDFWVPVGMGERGSIIDLDSLGVMDPELMDEMPGEMMDAIDGMADYIAEQADYFLGAEIDADALEDHWSDITDQDLID